MNTTLSSVSKYGWFVERYPKQDPDFRTNNFSWLHSGPDASSSLADSTRAYLEDDRKGHSEYRGDEPTRREIGLRELPMIQIQKEVAYDDF